jgi:adenosyl cobinamide kinase/adenosyl cobinamide phosphate guanylyltransferase
VEGGEAVAGLGLLDVETELLPEKTVREGRATLLATRETVAGYEIHHGRTRAGPGATPFLSDGLGYAQGNVAGVYLHGLFASEAFRRYFLRRLGVSAEGGDWGARLEGALDALADHLEAHLDLEAVDAVLFGPSARPRAEGRLVLVTGGARSGKSRYAEALAEHYAQGEPVLYLATLAAGDEEMVRRVARHRARRRAHWRTEETPLEPRHALQRARERVVLLDCLSGFVSNLLLEREGAGEGAIDAALREVEAFLEAVQVSGKVVLVVTNEVGSGVVPATPLGRLFRDALGLANARVAAAADAAALCVVGLPQPLKGYLPEVPLDPP